MTTNNLDLSNYIASLAAEDFPEFSKPSAVSAPTSASAPIVGSTPSIPSEANAVSPSVSSSTADSYDAVSSKSSYIEPIYTETSKEDYSFLSDVEAFPSGIDLYELTSIPESKIDPASSPYGISPIVLPNTGYTETYETNSIPNIIHGIDIAAVRKDFPILTEKVDGKDLVWLDNAATTQKPQSVIDRLSYYYLHENSNIHRAAHTLAARATDAYEDARNKTAKFLNAPSSDNIVFVRGTTEGINLIASTYGRKYIGKDDEIIVSILEHHANIVPWQLLCQETGAKLRVIPVDDSGQIILSEYEKLFNNRTKFVSVTNVSNALGTITPVQELVSIAHLHGVKILVDGAQSASHIKTDVQALDCDFFVFSGHKIYGPTGIGALYGKKEALEQIPPYQAGGNMIQDVTFERTIYQAPPNKFEAGTGNIADAIGLGAALDYVQKIGIQNIFNYEHYLLEYGTEVLNKVPGLKFVGHALNRTSVLSFVIDGYTTEEIGNALKNEGIAVRSGHHCAQPILRRFGLEAAVRPSLALYNTTQELDKLADVLKAYVKK
ncbi:MAG: family 2A encapsulin nanocompartment cargo protein cysteine desulfurase [Bacillota bacterium]|nr:family 2A encapsulin nanocompartment cargo protein cysteine desulfurase [Bacillota bacterium]